MEWTMKLFYSNQHGRSMIEMLGVLAIVGVLSIGGISQYSKAMTKYKLNRFIEQYNFIFNLIATDMDKWRRSKTDSFYSLSELWINMEAVPSDMIKEDKGKHGDLVDIFGNTFYVRKYKPYIAMNIFMNNNAYIRNACTVLYNNQISLRYNELKSAYLLIGNSKQLHPFYGNQFCNGRLSCLKDITMTDISNICNDCHNSQDCSIILTWNI